MIAEAIAKDLHPLFNQLEEEDKSLSKRMDTFEISQRDLKRDFALLIQGQLKRDKKQNAILTLVLIPALDSAGWNTWKYGHAFMDPYMTRDHFYLGITITSILMLAYAARMIHNSIRGKREQE